MQELWEMLQVSIANMVDTAQLHLAFPCGGMTNEPTSDPKCKRIIFFKLAETVDLRFQVFRFSGTIKQAPSLAGPGSKLQLLQKRRLRSGRSVNTTTKNATCKKSKAKELKSRFWWDACHDLQRQFRLPSAIDNRDSIPNLYLMSLP
jgi:hypothetical protein